MLDVAADWWREERRRAAYDGEPPRIYTVADACADYLGWYRDHRKALERAEYTIQRYILPILGNYQIGGGPPTDSHRPLTRTLVRKWHQDCAATPAQLRSKPGKPRFRPLETDEDRRKRQATANRSLTVLKAALNFAVKEGIVPKATADLWTVSPFRGVDAPKIRFLERDELLRLLRTLRDRDPDLALLAEAVAHTGCAFGELRSLQVDDYLPGSQAIMIRDGKTGSRKRGIFLSDEGAAFFDRQTAARPASAPMLLRRNRRWHKAEPNRPLRQACLEAQIHPPIGIHILRHTYASLYLMAGGDLPALSKQLGHADTRMTLRHYAHLADHWRREDAAKHVPRLGLEPPAGATVTRISRR